MCFQFASSMNYCHKVEEEKKLKVDDEEEGKVSPSRELYRIRGVAWSWVFKSEKYIVANLTAFISMWNLVYWTIFRRICLCVTEWLSNRLEKFNHSSKIVRSITIRNLFLNNFQKYCPNDRYPPTSLPLNTLQHQICRCRHGPSYDHYKLWYASWKYYIFFDRKVKVENRVRPKPPFHIKPLILKLSFVVVM